ncbi:helix-turn-helix domain-containing protein [Solibacillus ferritrahens]|uniref:helix-turn-helix domain-containing protein n=1 Tax=Solibacillus ferritrahens TaxID=3098620 RepID=UPI00300A77DC
MKPKKQDVAQRIKKIRENSGLSIAIMAERIGISKSTLNSYIRGLALPPENIVEKISLFTDIPKDWIYYGSLSEYINSYLLYNGHGKLLEDYPEIVDEISTKFNKGEKDGISEFIYPTPIVIERVFDDIYAPIFNKYVSELIKDFTEDIAKYPFHNETENIIRERYIKKVFNLIRLEEPAIKYGEDNRIFQIALKEFNFRVDLSMQGREDNEYKSDDVLLALLLQKFETRRGTIEILRAISEYFNLGGARYSPDIIEVFRENYHKLRKINEVKNNTD